MQAVKESNLDVGARTMESNNAEYLVRGLGYIRSIEDLEEAVNSHQMGTDESSRKSEHQETGCTQKEEDRESGKEKGNDQVFELID